MAFDNFHIQEYNAINVICGGGMRADNHDLVGHWNQERGKKRWRVWGLTPPKDA